MLQVVETPYPIYFEQALTCVRILARLMPFILESSNSIFIKDLVWSKQKILRSQSADGEEETKSSMRVIHYI